MLTKSELPECPVATTVQIIGSKWKLLILRNLMFDGKQRFKDFMKTIPAISKKVLTDFVSISTIPLFFYSIS